VLFCALNAETNWYRGRVSLDTGLTTNSVLASDFGLLGLWSFPFAIFVALIAGFLMGHLSRYRSYMVLGSFVIGYCFAETWRTYLFAEGIVWFLLFALWGACLWASRRPSSRRPSSRGRSTSRAMAPSAH
jgi:uncharacterized membrane protein YccC